MLRRRPIQPLVMDIFYGAFFLLKALQNQPILKIEQSC